MSNLRIYCPACNDNAGKACESDYKGDNVGSKFSGFCTDDGRCLEDSKALFFF